MIARDFPAAARTARQQSTPRAVEPAVSHQRRDALTGSPT